MISLLEYLPADSALSRELSTDGMIPSERLAMGTLDYLALNIELTDGVFRLLYRAHTEKNVEQPNPVKVGRMLAKAPAPPEPEPEAVPLDVALGMIQGMWSD